MISLRFRYNLQNIQTISTFLEKQGTFNFPILSNGLFSAAIVEAKTEYTGYASVWLRDNIYIAYGHYVIGKVDIAIQNVKVLITYFEKHKWRFENIIESKVDPQNPMNRLHIRFNGIDLEEINQKWAHAQNDALGYFLWFYCELARKRVWEPQQDEIETLALFPFYFQAINYWKDEDSGHWEETRKIEASSIGVVIAGLQALKQLLMETPLASFCKYKDKVVTPQLIEELIEKGTVVLEDILPAECIQSEPSKNRRYDAALLFLVYPLQVVGDGIANQILEDVINNLQGDYGIRRYLGDSFWSANYKEKLAPGERTIDFSDNISLRDSLLNEGEEAQWCIFDPIISTIFGI